MTIESTLEQIAASLASIDMRLAHFAKVETGLAVNKAEQSAKVNAGLDKKDASDAVKAAAQTIKDEQAKNLAADTAAAEEAARVAAELDVADDAALVGGADEGKVYDYNKDIAPLFNELLKKDKAALVALLAKYGAKKGADIRSSDYPAIVAELSV